ncbi:MAG: aspartate carbamoyltransferase regulatory subunit [Bacteroidaceae bacterium]|nr:aspartate carbamoyltransferase regulatory subunit [Bacteroidaceae bacterium]
MKRQELQVAALQNGTVIDHIPSEKLFEVVNLLHLERMRTPVTVGFNLRSKKMGHKSIIKVADKFFTDDELNLLSVVAPNVTLCIIRDYEVVEKKKVAIPETLTGIIRCNNSKCISNNEPGMRTRFLLQDKERGIFRCHYCNKQVERRDVVIK